MPEGAGGALSSQSSHRCQHPRIWPAWMFQQEEQPPIAATIPSCVCEPPPQFFICELWELDSM